MRVTTGFKRLIALGWIALLPSLTAAQTTGKLAGRVLDGATQEALPGAAVVIVGTGQGAATDLDGYYTILNVTPGAYTVRATYLGYGPSTQADVRVSLSATRTLDFSLQPAGVDVDEVVVTAERPIVELGATTTSQSVSADELKQLPFDNIQSVIDLQAGVVEGGHFRGGRSGEVRYLVDGLAVNDVATGGSAFTPESDAVQEVEVITGTFNAEYGQAMSGVVNTVLKEGGPSFSFGIKAYLGSYLPGTNNLLQETPNFSATGARNLQLTVGGPVVGDRLTFFALARTFASDGFLYGVRRYVADQTALDPTSSPNNPAYLPVRGDGAAVSLNPESRQSAQGKLTAKLFTSDKLTLEGLYQRDTGTPYKHLFRFIPDGLASFRQRSASIRAGYSKVLASTAFATVRAGWFRSDYHRSLFDSPDDPGYRIIIPTVRSDGGGILGIDAGPGLGYIQDNGRFYLAGQDGWIVDRQTISWTGKADFDWQVNRSNQVRFGVEGNAHRLTLAEEQLLPNDGAGRATVYANGLAVYGLNSPNHNEYVRKPVDLSGYVQDKIEVRSLFTINVGLRFDLFDAKARVPINLTDPSLYAPVGRDWGTLSPAVLADSAALRYETAFRATSVKWQISPRIGLAYPITDNGQVHVSYGHFFQLPGYELLYTTPEYEVQSGTAQLSLHGNADLEAQRTVAYEAGLQQGITETSAFDITVYAKDIRNLLSTEIQQTSAGVRYARYINRDYGNVRGLAVGFERRLIGRDHAGIGGRVDYTLQFADGNASDPRATFFNNQTDPPLEPPKQLAPLDWDRRHQLNLTVSLGQPDIWLVTMLGQVGTGFPYTPQRVGGEQLGLVNSGNRPGFWNVDAYGYRALNVAGRRLSAFVKLYNVFNRLNERDVFSDTGRATYTVENRGTAQQFYDSLSRSDFDRRPEFFSSPRQVTLGLEAEW